MLMHLMIVLRWFKRCTLLTFLFSSDLLRFSLVFFFTFLIEPTPSVEVAAMAVEGEEVEKGNGVKFRLKWNGLRLLLESIAGDEIIEYKFNRDGRREGSKALGNLLNGRETE